MAKTNKLVIANWKMNPESEVEAKEIASSIRKRSDDIKAKIVICPPFVFLGAVGKNIIDTTGVYLGAQDVSAVKGNSHTGSVGIDMLKEMNVKYVIIGHSDRRNAGDTDEIIAQKLEVTLKENIKGILCVGEKERNEKGDYFHHIKEQIILDTKKIKRDMLKNLIIAYEPVWAIGKSEREAIEPEKLHEMTIFIKRVLSDIFGNENAQKVPVLYGGSVGTENIKALTENTSIDGVLVGRESLKAKEFLKIADEVK